MENNTNTMFDIEKSDVLATIIDSKSKVEFQKIAANNLVQICYISALFIYDKYSDHNKRKISLDEFNFDFRADDNANISHINCQFMKNEFTIRIDKTNDNRYYDIYTHDDIMYGYGYSFITKPDADNVEYTDDEVPINWKSFKTNCIMCVVEEPYPYVQLNGIIKQANNGNYKDIHDTIIGYNLIRNTYISTYANGVETDLNTKQVKLIRAIGENISLTKALIEKTENDIKARNSFVNILKHSQDELNEKITANERVIRHGKRSIGKLMRRINKYK